EKQKGSRGIRRGQWYRLVFQFPIRQAYRGNYCDGAYTPPGLMISGTTVIHGLFTDNQHLFLGITPLYIHQQCAHDKGYCHERIALTS
ncbi:hypothetical protein, partial [Escherichia coli]|uniref:hypothetical protein n=1 Tax=Escherichia coli TaxID=562 RepID=UPI0028804906